MLIGLFDTPNYSFVAVGHTERDIELLIRDAWEIHCKETGADANYLGNDFMDSVRVLPAKVNTVYRDGEELL